MMHFCEYINFEGFHFYQQHRNEMFDLQVNSDLYH